MQLVFWGFLIDITCQAYLAPELLGLKNCCEIILGDALVPKSWALHNVWRVSESWNSMYLQPEVLHSFQAMVDMNWANQKVWCRESRTRGAVGTVGASLPSRLFAAECQTELCFAGKPSLSGKTRNWAPCHLTFLRGRCLYFWRGIENAHLH